MLKSRRDFFRLSGSALWITAGAAACAGSSGASNTTPNNPGDTMAGGGGASGAGSSGGGSGFLMMQISDTHWGFKGPPNPDPKHTIDVALAEIASWPQKPDLVVHTGDVSQMTTDVAQRKQRLAEAKAAFAQLGTELHVIPGEHDASLDKGAAFQEAFGPTHWAFEHKGVYMIGLDNASNPQGGLGDEQMAWFEKEVTKVPASSRLIVFAHRPLFPLQQNWDWFTGDGDKALAILEKHPGTTVFYGHIHQTNLAKTGATTHASVRGLAFPLPAPNSVPEKKPLPWDAAAVDHMLGYRSIVLEANGPVWSDRPVIG